MATINPKWLFRKAHQKVTDLPTDGQVVSYNETGMSFQYDTIQEVQFARKGTDQVVTSSTSLQDDTVLTFPVAANSTYIADLWLLWTGTGTGGFKWGLLGPAGSKGFDTNLGTTGQDLTDANNFGNSTSNANGMYHVTFIVNTVDAGTLTIKWAQNTANGTTTLKSYSSFQLSKTS